uniref:Reverse transcriptase RNase H-like domain-containing protein n=1 Tax=Romanomermis culicivorax TaxID=13658 RepID=A0A915HSR8_ROMCU
MILDEVQIKEEIQDEDIPDLESDDEEGQIMGITEMDEETFIWTKSRTYIPPTATTFVQAVVWPQKDRAKTENDWWTIACSSRVLKEAETLYSTTKTECLAVIYDLKQYRHYVMGFRVTVRTDHKPPTWLSAEKQQNQRLLKWALYLQQFNYIFKYIAG